MNSFQDTQAFIGYILIVFLFFAFTIIHIIAWWKIFIKAGKPGWFSIIPIYNLYVLHEISGRPGWWIIFYIIPILGIVISIVVSISLAKSFGRSTMFGIFGLWLFSFIGGLILGFGKSQYVNSQSTQFSPNQIPQNNQAPHNPRSA